jgi:hypothetical protein
MCDGRMVTVVLVKVTEPTAQAVAVARGCGVADPATPQCESTLAVCIRNSRAVVGGIWVWPS